MPRKATRNETDYVRRMRRRSAFELLEQGQARILSPAEYPEPLKRLLRRERTMIHLKIGAAVKRKLEARSRRTGAPVEELVRRWIMQGLRRDAG